MLLHRLSGYLIALALVAGSWPSTATRAASRAGASGYPYLVLIVMDGYRADYLSLAPMRHLHQLMARGMSYETAWVGQMESETPTGHATIATGVYPRKHGVVGFGWRDPASGAYTYMPTDLRQIRAGNLTRIMEQGGAPTLSDLIHARNRHDITISMSGEKYYASATMGAGADYVLYGKNFKDAFRPVVISPNVPPASSHYTSITGDSALSLQDRFVTQLAIQMARTMRPRALFVNLPNTDIAGHYFGGMRDRPDMASIVKGADWAIGQIYNEYRRLGLLNRTLFVVTADHGMASNRHIVPVHPIYDAVRASGILALDQELRISVGSIWLRDPQKAQTLASLLAARHFPGVEGALYKVGASFTAEPSTKPETHPEGTRAGAAKLRSLRPTQRVPVPARDLLRAYLDLADTEAGPTGPEILLPYGEDTTGLTVEHRKLWGSHGGFSWGVQHIPLVIAGPGVRHGSSHFPAKLVDIAPTIERLLGLPIPAAVDGVVLADALAHTTTGERTAQKAVQAGRLADVKALQAHSLAQSR